MSLEEQLKEEFSFTNKRNLAIKHRLSEEEIDKKLESLGFTRLTDFQQEKNSSSLDLTYSLSDLEKRKLQGIFGEKIAIFIKGKIKEFLESSLGSEWELHQGIKLKTDKADDKSMRYGQSQVEKGLDITDSTIRHRNKDLEDIREKIRSRHFITSEKLFEEFSNNQIPSIDQVYYALKFSGDERTREYHVLNTEGSRFSNQSMKEFDLKHVEDFKVIGLEVKTTENKAESLFSSHQREVRDKAQASPFLDLYCLNVEYGIESKEIPEEVRLRIEKVN